MLTYFQINPICYADLSSELFVVYIKAWSEFRSSHRSCPIKKSILKNFAKFTGKHLCQSHLCHLCQSHLCHLFLIKLQACGKKRSHVQKQTCSFYVQVCLSTYDLLLPQSCNFIKKRVWHRCFPTNFAKFVRITFL